MKKSEREYLVKLVKDSINHAEEISRGELYGFMTAEQRQGIIQGTIHTIEPFAELLEIKIPVIPSLIK